MLKVVPAHPCKDELHSFLFDVELQPAWKQQKLAVNTFIVLKTAVTFPFYLKLKIIFQRTSSHIFFSPIMQIHSFQTVVLLLYPLKTLQNCRCLSSFPGVWKWNVGVKQVKKTYHWSSELISSAILFAFIISKTCNIRWKKRLYTFLSFKFPNPRFSNHSFLFTNYQ